MKFVVSKSGLLAYEEASEPSAIEIPPGEKLVIAQPYTPTKVRFSWNGKRYWSFRGLFEECARLETEQKPTPEAQGD